MDFANVTRFNPVVFRPQDELHNFDEQVRRRRFCFAMRRQRLGTRAEDFPLLFRAGSESPFQGRLGCLQAPVKLGPVKLTFVFRAGSKRGPRFLGCVLYTHTTTLCSVRDSRPDAARQYMAVQSGSLPLLDPLRRSSLSACRQKGPRTPAQCLLVDIALGATGRLRSAFRIASAFSPSMPDCPGQNDPA